MKFPLHNVHALLMQEPNQGMKPSYYMVPVCFMHDTLVAVLFRIRFS